MRCTRARSTTRAVRYVVWPVSSPSSATNSPGPNLISAASGAFAVAGYSSGLPGAPTTIDYALGVNVANGWMFQNPEFNGYAGIAGYLPSRGISIVVENTNGPKVAAGRHISGVIAKQLTLYLTPDRPISRG